MRKLLHFVALRSNRRGIPIPGKKARLFRRATPHPKKYDKRRYRLQPNNQLPLRHSPHCDGCAFRVRISWLTLGVSWAKTCRALDLTDGCGVKMVPKWCQNLAGAARRRRETFPHFHNFTQPPSTCLPIVVSI